MVCRDARTHGSAPVNPLILETLEDHTLYNLGEGAQQCPPRISHDKLLNGVHSAQEPAADPRRTLSQPRPSDLV